MKITDAALVGKSLASWDQGLQIVPVASGHNMEQGASILLGQKLLCQVLMKTQNALFFFFTKKGL
jgi:hypothetical protein